MNKEIKKCVDCKWFQRWVPIFYHLRYCFHSSNEIDPVSGKSKRFAEHERYYYRDGGCGKDGKNWMQR